LALMVSRELGCSPLGLGEKFDLEAETEAVGILFEIYSGQGNWPNFHVPFLA